MLTNYVDSASPKASLKEEVERILCESGICCYAADSDSPLDIDSLTYVGAIVNLEDIFEIEFPEDVLGYKPSTYNGFVAYLCETIEKLL